MGLVDYDHLDIKLVKYMMLYRRYQVTEFAEETKHESQILCKKNFCNKRISERRFYLTFGSLINMSTAFKTSEYELGKNALDSKSR